MSSIDSKIKEVNFHLDVSEGDYAVKMRHAEESFEQNISVRLQLKFRGREMMRQNDGLALVRRMKADLSGMGVADVDPKLVGKSVSLMLTPLPPDKQTRRFLR